MLVASEASLGSANGGEGRGLKMASDTETARELEHLRVMEMAERLGEEYRVESAAIERTLAANGHGLSGAVSRELNALAVRKARQYTDARIEIRKELSRDYPALSEGESIAVLAEDLKRSVALRFAGLRDHLNRRMAAAGVAVNLGREFEAEIFQLQAESTRKVEILKREIALNLHRPTGAAVAVHTSGGPAIVNLGQIHGNVEQVVNSLDQTGSRELAAVLKEFMGAIERTVEISDAEKVERLEQLEFIAEQSIALPEHRKPGVVRVVFEGMRARLQDVANIAQIASVAGPLIAHHFGYKWP
jgi:hypothetical protein